MSKRAPTKVSDGSLDPMRVRIAERRRAKGYSYQRLAREAGLNSASYMLYIENGTRFPSEEVAVRIARALDDDQELYRAWSRLRSGRRGRVDYESWILASDTYRTLSSAQTVATWRIPVLNEGDDPDQPHEIANFLLLDPAMYGLDAPRAMRALAALRDPFAFLLGATQASRAPGLVEGCYTIVSRDPTALESTARIEPRAAYAVRVEDRVELVSGEALSSAAAIPSELAACCRRDPTELRARVIGKVEVILTGFRSSES